MIYFNQETRQFSIAANAGKFLKNHGLAGVVGGAAVGAKRALIGTHGKGYGTSMAVGSLAGAGINKLQKNKYERDLIRQGKDPKEAKRLASQRFGSGLAAGIKGAGAGAGIRFVGKRAVNGARDLAGAFKNNI